jgi:hypothetical protein
LTHNFRGSGNFPAFSRFTYAPGDNLQLNSFVLILLLAGCVAYGQTPSTTPEGPDANPGRPTVSTPATLTPVGYLQFENGMVGAVNSPEFDTRFGVNQVTKLTVAQRLEFLLQTEPLVRSRDLDFKEIHAGEVFLGAQALVLPGTKQRPTVSVSYIRRLYASPAPEIDIGSLHRAQYGQTLSISHPLKKLTISGEIWHFTQPFLRGNAVGNLWAVSYPIRKNLVIDGGFDHGFTGTSTHWEGFAGFTYLLPRRLWKQHDR